MKPSETIEKMFTQINIETNTDVDKVVLGDAVNAMSKSKQKTPASNKPDIWRIIMKTKITKFAAAAVIIIAVLIGINTFLGTGASVTLADVLERIEQAQAYMYKVKRARSMTAEMPTGKQEMLGSIIISNEYGMKIEMDTTDPKTGKIINQQIYIIPDQKAVFIVIPEQKKVSRIELDDALLSRMKKQNNDPRGFVKQMMSCDYTVLGRSVIDGIEVEGFETTDARVMGGMAEDVKVRLWVDIETWLPVRQEFDVKAKEQMQTQSILYDFHWDIQVDASDFEPDIPEDFTGLPTHGMKLSLNEKAAIDGLRFFAEILERYPKKLNFRDLMREFAATSDREDKIEDMTEGTLKLQEEMEKMTEDEKSKKTMEIIRLFQSPSIFYMTLVQDKKEPVYSGETVGPEDADAILMRWKVSEDECRVIYGDLTAETISTEQLAELEATIFK